MRHPLFVVFFLLTITACQPLEEVTYLTWRSVEATTSITVNHISKRSTSQKTVYYDTVSREDRLLEAYQFKTTATSKDSRGHFKGYLHSIDLTELKPDTTYYFRVGDAKNGFSEEKKFRTPSDQGPLRLAVGGDVDIGRTSTQVAKGVALRRPDAVLIGGDLAYGNALYPMMNGRWNTWMQEVVSKLQTPEGHLIPIIAAIGNHETRPIRFFESPLRRAPYFLSLFSQTKNQRTYFARRLNQDTVVFVLDSGYVHSVHGEQTRWLAEALENYKDVPHKLALYHAPMYPAHRDFYREVSVQERIHWLPLFEKYGVKVALEHDDHLHKRTPLLKNGEVCQEGGVLFLGDGCWGQEPRRFNLKNRSYIASAESRNHFWLLRIAEEMIEAKAIDLNGATFDEVRLISPLAESPCKHFLANALGS